MSHRVYLPAMKSTCTASGAGRFAAAARQTIHNASIYNMAEPFSSVPSMRSVKIIGTSTILNPLPPQPVGHLDLKAVIVQPDGHIEINNDCQRAAAKAFVAARGVGERHPGDRAGRNAPRCELNISRFSGQFTTRTPPE